MAEMKKRLRNLYIDVVAAMAKIGLFLTLPFKFIEFFCESWKKNN